MINGIYHNNYTPYNVNGTAAQKDGYYIREAKLKQVTLFSGSVEEHRENYTMIKCRTGLEYEFHIPGMIHHTVGTSIQIVPFETNTGDTDWPSLSYTILGSLDGVHWNALPTAIGPLAVTSTHSTIHSLLLPYTVYKVVVTGAANTGWFSVISN